LGEPPYALAVASLLLRQSVEDRVNWTLPRLRAEIERQTRATISAGGLSVLLKRGSFGWRRPRHSLTRRQDAQAVDRMGLRLALRHAQAVSRRWASTLISATIH